MALRNRSWSGAPSTTSSTRAPVSQMSAAALAAGTEQLALVAALRQGTDDAGASRLGMSAVLLEDQGELLPDDMTRREAIVKPRRARPFVIQRSPLRSHAR
jgi:hypothetical protein